MTIGIDASRAFVKKRTGTENYAYQLLKHIAKIDRSNHYILYTNGSNVVDFALPSNFWVKSIPLPRLWTQVGLASRTFFDPVKTLFIPSHTLPVIRRPRMKTVVTIHGLEYEYLPQHYQFPQKLLLNRSTEYAVRHADCLIAVSRWTKEELVRRLGADPQKIKVIYEGVDVDQFKVDKSAKTRVKRKYKIRGDFILFVGTIQPRKNLERLVEAFKLLLFDYSGPLSLVLAGKKGWMYDKILTAPKRFGVGDKVKFLGHVPDSDLVALYHGARVFCLPSLMEGFGLPVLEAMASGCPVVASRVGALPEVMGKAGLLVNPKKANEIADALSLVLKNPGLSEDLREKGLRRVKSFSWQKASAETVEILSTLE